MTLESLARTIAKARHGTDDKFLRKADPTGATKEFAIVETTITNNPPNVNDRIVGVFKSATERDDAFDGMMDYVRREYGN